MPRNPQIWKCPKCGSEYGAPIQAFEVTCSKSHLKPVLMTLIAGKPLERREVTPRWKESMKPKPEKTEPTKPKSIPTKRSRPSKAAPKQSIRRTVKEK